MAGFNGAITKQEAVAYMAREGARRANGLFAMLQRLGKFKDALDTEVGQQLLADDKQEIIDLLDRFVSDDTFSEQDRIRLRVCVVNAERRGEKVMKYYQGIGEIKKSVGPE